MDDTKMEWPDFFPDDCPPKEAQPASGEVYRLVDKNPPKRRDFKSHKERKPSEYEDCIACGLSVYRRQKDILQMKERMSQSIPSVRKKQIARGLLEPSLGRILPTPQQFEPSHHTWWVPLHSEPWTFFQVLLEL